jgi:hypothetical protein
MRSFGLAIRRADSLLAGPDGRETFARGGTSLTRYLRRVPVAARRRRLSLLPLLALAAWAGSTGSASAGSTVSEVTVLKPFEFVAPSCVPNEQVVATGTVRHRIKTTVDESGGVHVQDEYTAHGSGSGYDAADVLLLDPVASYSISDQQLQHTNFPAPTFEYTAAFYTRVIRHAETAAEDDLFLRSQVKMTMNAKGAVTAEFVRGPTLECR